MQAVGRWPAWPNAIAITGAIMVMTGCGGDEEADAPPRPNVTTPIELTAGEFLVLDETEKKSVARSIFRATPGCGALSPSVAIVIGTEFDAERSDPDRLVWDIVTEFC